MAAPTTPASVLSRDQLLANLEDRKHAGFDFDRLASQHTRARYYEVLEELCRKKKESLLPPVAKAAVSKLEVVSEDAMTYDEAVKFHSSMVFPAGKYQGMLVHEAPASYILWWVEGNPFTRDLRRYIKSRLFQDRQDAEYQEHEERENHGP